MWDFASRSRVDLDKTLKKFQYKILCKTIDRDMSIK
jgi:hypothetical protein